MKTRIRIPRFEIEIYNNSTFDRAYPNVHSNHFFAIQEKIHASRKVHAKNFISWILKRRKAGYTTFILPYAKTPQMQRSIDMIRTIVYEAGKKYGFTVLQTMPPDKPLKPFQCLHLNPFDCLHYKEGRIFLS